MAEHLLSTAVHDTLPGNYVRPESQRPRLAEVVTGARIPVVDLGSPDRAAVVAAIGDACRSHGFFQVHCPKFCTHASSYGSSLSMSHLIACVRACVCRSSTTGYMPT
jgi:hypothetical protein